LEIGKEEEEEGIAEKRGWGRFAWGMCIRALLHSHHYTIILLMWLVGVVVGGGGW